MRRLIAIVVFALLLPIAAHAAWDYIESRRLFAAIDDLRKRGEPVSRNALGYWVRPTDEEEIRSARYYSAAASLAFRDWVLQRPGDKVPEVEAKRRIFSDLDAISKSGTLTPEVAERLKLVRDSYREALDMSGRAAPLRFSKFPPFGFEDYPRMYSLEALSLACSAETVLLTFQTTGDEAAQSLWSCLRLRRAHVREMWVGGYSVNHLMAELRLVLEKTLPSPALLSQVQAAFAERERPDLIERDLRERRALLIESMLAELYGPRADPLTPAAHLVWTWRPSTPTRPWVVRGVTEGVRRLDDVLAAASQPWPAKVKALDHLLGAQPRPRQRSGPLDLRYYARYVAPNVSAESAGNVLTRMRTAQAALAVERYRRERGVLPPSLAELVPAYLAVVPNDPFTGKGLTYRADNTGFRVYGVGANGTDDGGDVEPLTGLAATKSKDVGLLIRVQETIR